MNVREFDFEFLFSGRSAGTSDNADVEVLILSKPKATISINL
jgi:hypothetical protein